MIPEQINIDKLFNKKLIRNGIVIFLAISVLSFIGLFVYNEGASNLEIWKKIELPFILLSLVFVFNDLYLGGLRNHIFFAYKYPGLSQMVCFRANLACLFMGAATPSQTGGGPTQWYIWYRAGIKLVDIIKASFFNFLSTIVFFPLAGGLAYYFLRDKIPDGITMPFIKIGFFVFSMFLVLMVAAIYSPKIIALIFSGIAKILGFISPKYAAFIKEKSITIVETLTDYRITFLELIRTRPQLLFYSFALTVILYLNKFVLAFVLAKAFHLDVEIWNIVFVMAVGYMLLYFAPSPGGSGIAEVSIAGMLSSFMTGDYATSITLLHRSFLIFIPAILGGFVVFREISRHTAEKKAAET